MSYDNQEGTLHQTHLDKQIFHKECESCWHEPVEAFLNQLTVALMDMKGRTVMSNGRSAYGLFLDLNR